MAGCKVTVVCTAYNHEAYLRDALEGFVSQETDFPFEVLVNDDASTDGTAAILREYAARYPDIIRPFYQEKNLYSQGINIYDAVFYPVARGEYIAACEGDDRWTDPHKLQLQVDFLDAHPDYSACVHNTLAHTVGGEEPDRVLFEQGEDRDVPFEQVIRGMSHAFHTSSILARREYIVNPPEFRNVAFRHGFTDYAVGVWLTLNGKVRFLDRCMSVYRCGLLEQQHRQALRQAQALYYRRAGDAARRAGACGRRAGRPGGSGHPGAGVRAFVHRGQGGRDGPSAL